MNSRIGIVGAGVAGLTCARRLVALGHEVALFDKGRFPGGRVATREHEGLVFDHGAQYVRAHSLHFAAALERWKAAGVLEDYGNERWVGAPTMRALAEQMADGLDVRLESTVTGVSRGSIALDDGSTHTFDAVVVSAPIPQVRKLLPDDSTLRPLLSAETHAPCWALMLAFEERIPKSIEVSDDVVWAARESDKPERGTGERWIVHATSEWSTEHVELSREDAAERLLEVLRRANPELPAPTFSRAHRWRFARAMEPIGVNCVFDAKYLIGVCGDGFVGASIENAWLSGRAMAESLDGHLS